MSDRFPIPEPFPRRLRMICQTCGSEKVMRDAWAVWNSDDQLWDLGSIFDAAFCEDCDGECKISEVEETKEDRVNDLINQAADTFLEMKLNPTDNKERNTQI